MIGGVWVGMNPRYQKPEILHVLKDAEPKILFSLTDFEGRDLRLQLEEIGNELLFIDRIVSIGTDPGPWQRFEEFLAEGAYADRSPELLRRLDATTGDDPLLLVYTSGTTGKPKGALLSHRGLIGRAITQNATWPCEHIRIINSLPINHIGSVGFISMYALVGGGTQFLQERLHPGQFLDVMERERITVWIGLPVTFALILDDPSFSGRKLHSLQWVIWSGAAMPIALIERVRALGAALGSSYGLTESTGSVCYAPADADDLLLSRTIGRPTPPGEVRIAGPDGTPVPPGTDGEIQVRPDWAMKGYHRLEEHTREARASDGWIRTGDVGREDECGCIELVGRTKEMFKSGGYNVYPREIELAVEAHPEVEMCAVIAMPDPRFQEVGTAFVQLVPGATLEIEALAGWCRTRLANYKVPKRFVILDRLPMLAVGKVDKQKLRVESAVGSSGS
jgi:acyl-CoA synthetase (AMP-forming)/AMP-acid ligase II